MHLLFVKLPLLVGLALLSFTAISLPAQAAPAAPKSGILSYTVPDIAGKPVPLSRYAGRVLLIVNTASLCSNAPVQVTGSPVRKVPKSGPAGTRVSRQ